jgi:hypothetical protein
MDILQETKDIHKKTFFTHVFSTTDEGKAEILNVVQYSLIGVIPIILLNKLIQRFIPEADGEKSSLELLVEVLIQLIIMFCGIIIVHRVITYIPTYSGFKYENLTLTNVILAFLIIVLSIQTKLGIKVNILWDRVNELWSGSSKEDAKAKNGVKTSKPTSHHVPSQADYLDNSTVQSNMFPPAPVATAKHSQNGSYDHMMRGNGISGGLLDAGPMPSNFAGSVFGAAF